MSRLSESKVWGLALRVQRAELRFSGFGVDDAPALGAKKFPELQPRVLRIWIKGLRLRAWGVGLLNKGSGRRAWDFGLNIKAQGAGLRV